MSKELTVILIKDLDWNINDRVYKKGEVLRVVDFSDINFKLHYAYYYDDNLDWISKDFVEIISE